MEPIILASSSPRRQEILKSLNIPFQVKISQIDENYPSDIDVHKVPEYLALKKVKAVAQLYSPEQKVPWILGADTMVCLDDQLLGKPKDAEEAVEYLKRLQGNTHEVVTGIALLNGDVMFPVSRTSITKVSFAPMTDKEIEWYVDSGEWHGAAGGYRIQGLASCFINKVEGIYSNVVGLPIFELYDMFKEQGYSFID